MKNFRSFRAKMCLGKVGIHSINVLSSVSLFCILRTKLHRGRVGQCLTRSAKSRIQCNSPFFSKWVTRFVQPADMEMENSVDKGKRLLQFWGGESLHIIDLVYLLKSVQLALKYLNNLCKKSGKTWSTFSNMANFGRHRKWVSLAQNSVSLAVNAFKPHVKWEWHDTVCICAGDTEFRWFPTGRTLFLADDTELQFVRSELHTFWQW